MYSYVLVYVHIAKENVLVIKKKIKSSPRESAPSSKNGHETNQG